jgi:hypothetical protein
MRLRRGQLGYKLRVRISGVSVFKSIAALAVVAALSFVGAAQAATIYTFHLDTVDPSGELAGVTDAGTITVTDTGVDLFVAVALDNGFEFRHAPDNNHHSFVFDSDQGHASISNLHPTYFFQVAGTSFTDSPFNSSPWNNAIDCTLDAQATGAGCSNGAKAGNPTSLSFKVAGITFSDLVSKPYTGANGLKHIFFAADVVGSLGGYKGNTGNVGATWDGNYFNGAPEPAAWALMIVGFGGVGGALRRRRRALARAA